MDRKLARVLLMSCYLLLANACSSDDIFTGCYKVKNSSGWMLRLENSGDVYKGDILMDVGYGLLWNDMDFKKRVPPSPGKLVYGKSFKSELHGKELSLLHMHADGEFRGERVGAEYMLRFSLFADVTDTYPNFTRLEKTPCSGPRSRGPDEVRGEEVLLNIYGWPSEVDTSFVLKLRTDEIVRRSTEGEFPQRVMLKAQLLPESSCKKPGHKDKPWWDSYNVRGGQISIWLGSNKMKANLHHKTFELRAKEFGLLESDIPGLRHTVRRQCSSLDVDKSNCFIKRRYYATPDGVEEDDFIDMNCLGTVVRGNVNCSARIYFRGRVVQFYIKEKHLTRYRELMDLVRAYLESKIIAES